MTCLFCGEKTTVVESRSGLDEIIRCRKCLSCGKMFFTCETDMDYEEGKRRLREYQLEKKRERRKQS